MYKWFLAWRYLHTKLIAFFGIASVMLCVAMVLVVLSVMGGFLDTVRERSRGLHSQIVVQAGTIQGFPYYEEFAELLTSDLGDVVRVTTPAIQSFAILREPKSTFTKGTQVFGIVLDDYIQVNDFAEALYYNRFFPGTTHLGKQQVPVAALGDKGTYTLPEDLRAAHALWRQTASQADVAAFDANPFVAAVYPGVIPGMIGERVFCVDRGPARYEGSERAGIIVGGDVLFNRRADGNFNRHYARGTEMALTVMPMSPSGKTMSELAVLLPVRYVDDSRTGIFEIDSMSVYVDFAVLQHRLAMDPQPLRNGGMSKPRTNQLLIGLQPGAKLNDARDQITGLWNTFLASLPVDISYADQRSLGFVNVYTWEDIQRPFIAAVAKEKVLVTFLFGLIGLVAIVLVGCIFYMIVEKKTRDIGVIKALGASGNGVAGLFMLYALAVGVAGAILGVLLGSVFVWNINGIQDFLATLHPELRVWSPDVYSFDRIPEIVKTADAVWIGSCAVLASLLGSLIPVIIAGRVWPVKALRYE